jgi:hypothetical protein
MEKQHNRGQEGAGLACVKLEASPGEEYMFRERALGTEAITEIFAAVHEYYKDLPPDKLNDPLFAKTNLPFAGELYMGHLRYSTTGSHIFHSKYAWSGNTPQRISGRERDSCNERLSQQFYKYSFIGKAEGEGS